MWECSQERTTTDGPCCVVKWECTLLCGFPASTGLCQCWCGCSQPANLLVTRTLAIFCALASPLGKGSGSGIDYLPTHHLFLLLFVLFEFSFFEWSLPFESCCWYVMLWSFWLFQSVFSSFWQQRSSLIILCVSSPIINVLHVYQKMELVLLVSVHRPLMKKSHAGKIGNLNTQAGAH